MYTPAILFAFSGIVVGLGTLFTTEAIFGEMATAGHLWFDCWNVLLQGGWTLFNQMPLLFCVALPISLANKQNARCCMEALAIYLTFNYFVSTILGQWALSLASTTLSRRAAVLVLPLSQASKRLIWASWARLSFQVSPRCFTTSTSTPNFLSGWACSRAPCSSI
ncbi:PTS transporter subunit EIIC [Collinsella aerofaciens]|uniref:PTS transporter subunit EIIC n=1 Tax=Collinsella aerofaciens TaxID=74426 RepID=UPI00319D991B